MTGFSKIWIILLTTLLVSPVLKAQEGIHFTDSSETSISLPIKISQNLIIITLSLNGSAPMNFVLDSGIRNTIITELTGVDSVNLLHTKEVYIAGLGSGEPGKAYLSTNNNVFIQDPNNTYEGLSGNNHNVYILTKDHFSLSKQLGMQINGLIGSEFFKHFIVEIDYLNHFLTFYKPDSYKTKRKHRKYFEVPVEIVGNKAFVQAKIRQERGRKIPVKLMLDTGASLPVWLAAHTDTAIRIPKITIPALLGQGLNGPIGGVNGRVSEIEFGGQIFKNALVSFPDSSSVSGMMETNDRNGSLGNDILRRFHIIFDYPSNRILLRPNRDIDDPFSYNISGMEVEKPYLGLPIYTIFDIIEGSPADLGGVKKGDQLVVINHIYTKNMSLNDINTILHGYGSKKIRLKVNRNGEYLKIIFNLREKL